MLAKSVYETLNSTEASYGEAVFNIASTLEYDLPTANKELFNLLICDYILRFEADNHSVLQHINNFNGIVNELSTAISDKKKNAPNSWKACYGAT